MAEPSLELLQHMMQQVLDEVRVIRTDQREIIQRLSRLERLTADLHQDWAAQSARIDNLAERIGRVEKRLELTS